MNPKTKEWKDGVLSTIMRDMNKNNGVYKPHHKNKWIILDGDVDPEWIESLNTVMDDNKVLTLVSQERIPLTPEMRLILEVSNLRNATPATVSRGGVLFINDSDVGWRPYFDSWLAKYKKMEDTTAENVFTLSLSTYITDQFLDDIKQKSHIAPICDMSQVQTLTTIIDQLFESLHSNKAQNDHMKRLRADGKDEEQKIIYEGFFIYAMMWAYGGSLDEDKIAFSGYMKSTSKIKFPEQGQCFDYFFEPIEGKWVNWDERVGEFNKEYEGLFQNLVVPTAETTRQSALLDIHVAKRKGVLYVGSAGTGKTVNIQNFFSSLDPENTLSASMNFNSYTDSKALQVVVESQVDKRAGRTFGPPPSKTLIYFMDDLNMPYLDKYGTQSPICLIRQIIDYGIVYDRDHLEEKKYLVDIMFTACMNPKSGSFYVDLRLSRHFTLVSCLTAENNILKTIYLQILDNHMSTFEKSVADLCPKIINATLTVFKYMATQPQFMPTARKFHYQFNLRDFARIVQNIMLAQPNHYRGNPLGIARLWAHECHRVWYDRLIFEEDREAYMNQMRTAVKEFTDMKEEAIFEEPLLYTSYVSACEGHEPAYLPIKGMDHLKGILEAKLEEYNDQVASMNLVLFDQAMEHISRIARIISLPVGSALLVGVGGSGKQSLAKLSSFILGYDIFRIVVTSNYNMNDLKTDIQTMFVKSGVQGAQLLFILTDSQITDDRFLVYINDLLSSGYIPELFPKDELDGILGKVRSEAKQAGCQDTPDELFDFFLQKVRRNLHLGLCFSPVGDAFRFRARMFPGVVNCTSMDWFHEWPRDALIDVAQRFLAEIEFPTDEIRESIAANMAQVHLSIGEANIEFLQQERRHNYTTPTSYLELINFYKLLLGKKRGGITDQINRLEIGLQTMKSTTEQVEGLQKLLEVKMVDVGIEKEKTGELIAIVEKESADAKKEADAAAVQEEDTIAATNAANAEKANCDKELAEAIPAMERATEAVNCLEVTAIQNLKALGSPPAACVEVSKAVLILLKGEKKNHAWQNGQKMMNNPGKFIEEVQKFEGENIDEWKLEALKPIMAQDFFNFETMKTKSTPAAYLCSWIINIVNFNTIYKKVKPLKEAADAAQATADQKSAELAIVKEKVRVINEKVDGLKQQLQGAIDKKQQVEDEAQNLQDQLDLANRLVNGLADENTRWANNVVTYKDERVTMIGDALVSAAFVSYIGPFSYTFRAKLWKDAWIPDIYEKKIPITEGVDPLFVLANTADQAVWMTEGLPADRVSLENAAVVCSCNRYPLIIDPQLQGMKWIKGKEGAEMVILQLTQKNWLKKVEMAVSNGNVLMIEAIGEEIDAILDPLLSRQFVKKGKNFMVKLGSEDVEISPHFKLYLQTKLINPHYKPETAAQCTIINFIVTEAGLEDQLLAMVVRVEKPDLEQTKEELVNKQNQFKVTLAKLESDLLTNLSDADPATILQNTELIEGLEITKKTSMEIQEQQAIAKETEVKINTLREVYRRVAAEGAMLYFLLIQLCVVTHMYQYSLESFTTFFFKAIQKTEQFEEEEPRVLALRDMIRMTIYQWVSRGLFEKHKQIFRTQLTFRLMQKKILNIEYTDKEMHFLLNCPPKTDIPNPAHLKEWLPDLAWFSINRLIEIEGFEQFAQNLEKEAPNRFKDWYNEITPEDEKLPLDWKKLEQMQFQKLLVIRVLRPDRITTALDNFVRRTLPNGDDYVDCDSTSSFQQVLMSSYSDSTPQTPIFFILSPGANPVKDVEMLAKKNGIDPVKQLHTIALGQGQDVIAMNKLDIGHKEGHWVMLQNIHLMPRFLLDLEKKLDAFAVEGSNQGFRLFVSSDPSNSIPIGLLERSIKLTNEPPQGLKQNMKRAFTFFTKEDIEDKDPKIKTILFALCYFHSVMLERRKFGAKGWNMKYPFSVGDLRDSAIVLNNYMEDPANAGGKIPWDDLKFLFGEIMYGGHIVDDWDRILCKAYLDNLMNDTLLDEAELFPYIEGKGITFKCPPPYPYEKYIEHIETECPPETPLAFGMHPNAEIDFRTQQCIELFMTLQDIQPRDSSSGAGAAGGIQEKIVEFMVRVNDEAQLDSNKLNIDDIVSKLGEDTRTPYQNSFLQECEYMNQLIKVIVVSLAEIDLAFKGELTMTEKMESLMDAIAMNKVPAPWEKLAFPSTRGLGSWLDNLKQRLEQLNLWKEDPTKIPPVTFINRLFNPQSFLTAIKQVYAIEKQQELNKLIVQTDVLKKWYWEADLPPVKEGAYVFGFQVEGARWDAGIGQLEESLPKKAFSVVPVVNCRAAPLSDGKDEKGIYQCPCYTTTNRGNTYVFTAQMKTKLPPSKWILAGVALILDVEGVSDAFAPGKEGLVV
jgi:dynein heavy chain